MGKKEVFVEKMPKNEIDYYLPPSHILSDNSLRVKQENSIVRITHNSKPIDISPFSKFDLVVLEEKKRVPHLYEDTKVLVAIRRMDDIQALIARLELECSHNPKSTTCELLGEILSHGNKYEK
jgi:hypothetical protein